MSIEGFVDKIASNEVAGWAFDTEAPDTAVHVDVIAEGRVVASGLAGTFRPDLKSAGIGDGSHGFAIPADIGERTISCRAAGRTLPLSFASGTESNAQKAGEYWDNIKTILAQMPPRARFTGSPRILREVNERVCGRPIDGNGEQGVMAYLRDRIGAGLPLGRAVSVGCGPGFKEMNLVRNGLVRHFDLFDVSQESLQSGRNVAAEWGVADKVDFIHGYDYRSALGTDYDLVYWDAALHHMFDADAAVLWSRDVLKPGGWFFMSDFVGANRFQWPDEVYRMVDLVRGSLPEHCFHNPMNPAAPYARKLHRTTLQEMDYDPSEAADSEAIIPSVLKYFPDATINHIGGTIYHMALNDVLTNISEDSDLLEYLLALDRNIDLPHFATGIARKPL